MSFGEPALPINLFLLTDTEQLSPSSLYTINSSSLAYIRNVSLRGTEVTDYKTLQLKILDLNDLQCLSALFQRARGTEGNKKHDEAVMCAEWWTLLTPHWGLQAWISHFYFGKKGFKYLDERFLMLLSAEWQDCTPFTYFTTKTLGKRLIHLLSFTHFCFLSPFFLLFVFISSFSLFTKAGKLLFLLTKTQLLCVKPGGIVLP